MNTRQERTTTPKDGKQKIRTPRFPELVSCLESSQVMALSKGLEWGWQGPWVEEIKLRVQSDQGC